MAFFKWFGQIEALRESDKGFPKSPLPQFDFAALKPASWGERIGQAVGSFAFQRIIPPVLRLCQQLFPIPSIPFMGLVIVTRDEDVREVLNDADSFGVPYGPEMRDLGAGTTFGLGLDGADHARQRAIMADVMNGGNRKAFQQDLARILDRTDACARALLENGAGRLDVIRDYITRIATETAQSYFGLDIADSDAFAEWSLAASCMLFGDPKGDRKTRDIALNAGARLRMSLANSISRAQRNWDSHPGTKKGRDETILDRLIALQRKRSMGPDPISDAEINAILMGMVTGFIPTNTLAAAKILAELLRRPAIMAEARTFAGTNQRDQLKAILMEAARLDSALAPGQWRVARNDAWIAKGARRARRVKQGTIILVSTMTALRDRRRFRRPNQFRVDRLTHGDLMFGWGPHACMGAEMAIEQITTMFMVLLARPGLTPVSGKEGRMEYTGVFPVRLDMRYDHPGATQSMFLVVVPVPAEFEATKERIDEEIGQLGNPAKPPALDAFHASGIVHFASLATVDSEAGLHIILELSVDGEADTAIGVLAESAGELLRPVFAFAGLGEKADVAEFLRRHIVRLHSRPWGATGLEYNGTSEFSVAMIARQRDLAAHVETILAEYLGRAIGDGNQPMRALTHVRRILKGDRYHRLMTRSARAPLITRSAEQAFDTLILKPGRARLKLADFSTPGYWTAAGAFLTSRWGIALTLPVLALWILLAVGLWQIVAPPSVLACSWPSGWSWAPWRETYCTINWAAVPRAGWGLFVVIAGATVAAALGVAALMGGALAWLRRLEASDPVDDEPAPIERIAAIVATEDAPGYAQNHIMAVGVLKPGLFRTLVHAFALWAIRMIIVFYYRPGFVINMGTIHYARWWRLPGTRRSIFYSNYDGSWDSYLEDFITRARWGQTAAWSNWQGFPRTRSLIFGGAEDGDRFKRWVRKQQQPAPFWYSRFPDLTTDQIRNNALIHHGIARAQNDSEAREWLRCFGSMPRLENRIETHEVQSLVFRGLPSLKYSSCMAIHLPPLADKAFAHWLDWILGGEKGLDDARRAIVDRFPFAFAGQDSPTALLQPFCVAFGDRQSMGEDNPAGIEPEKSGWKSNDPSHIPEWFRADRPVKPIEWSTFLACSAAGFRKICAGLPNGLGDDLPAGFSPAFQMGMGARPQILGDVGDTRPAGWLWSDTETAGPPAVEAVIFLYAQTDEKLQDAKKVHLALLESHGGALVHARDCEPIGDSIEFEHFGFRDGISQPVIRGTGRFSRGAPARDIVEPGEFLLGYASNQGFLPPSPLIREEADPADNLPVPSAAELSRFPDFGAARSGGLPRDFGRNGSYVVIRELEQHVERFSDFAHRKAAELVAALAPSTPGQTAYPDLFKIAGQLPTPTWVKTKMIGRWPDGRPLVGNPVAPPERAPQRTAREERQSRSTGESMTREIVHYRDERFNDFAFGTDDPQGFACPFGAHIRRANPRDSKQPGDPVEQSITNRHRLLRRGRSYGDSSDENSAKGMLFVALCSDLERQYEFVQQTWLNSPGFHGLSSEPDPLTSPNVGTECNFTIPTPAGPVKLAGIEQFVTVRAGGYFFLPSRSALAFLRETAFQFGNVLASPLR